MAEEKDRAKLFWSGNSQAVRLPKAYRFASEIREVTIRRWGDEIILEPVDEGTWPESFWDLFGELSDDFERPEQVPQEREPLD